MFVNHRLRKFFHFRGSRFCQSELPQLNFQHAAIRCSNGNAVLSVWHNGVLIHDKVEIKGPTGGGQPETDKPGPFQLQGHGGQVQYRNIWVVETNASESK